MRSSEVVAGMALLVALGSGACAPSHRTPYPDETANSPDCPDCDTTAAAPEPPVSVDTVVLDTAAAVEPPVRVDTVALDTTAAPPPMPIGDTVAVSMPEFPWPPPSPTSRYVVPFRLLPIGPTTSLGDVYDRLITALDRGRVEERSVYARGNNGIALVARVESIDDDGKAKPGRLRWQATPPREGFSGYINRLFRASPGRYRVLVFVVTGDPVMPAPRNATPEEMQAALRGGAGDLPATYRAMPASAAHCEALIYEFFRSSAASAPRLVVQSTITPTQHIAGAGLWSLEDLRR
jgi:hypothetical protein